ncbi:MAG: hypothetical protein QOE34_282 [Verrucomicrobiota bacterium]
MLKALSFLGYNSAEDLGGQKTSYQATQRTSVKQETEQAAGNLGSSLSMNGANDIRAEFLRITDDVSVYHKESHEEIKLTAGMTVRLIVRYRHDVTIGYKGAYYSIPTAFTQPTK